MKKPKKTNKPNQANPKPIKNHEKNKTNKKKKTKLSAENPPLTNPETLPRQALSPTLDWSGEGFPRIV